MAKDFQPDEISLALNACYDAVLAPQLWDDALARLARSVDAVHALFYPINPDRTDPNPIDPARPIQDLPASRDYKPLLGEYLAGGWHLNHYRANRSLPLFDAGQRVVIEHDLASDDERRRLPQYNELYLKWGLPGFAAASFTIAGRQWAVPFMRGAGQGHFSRAEAERIAEIAPHLVRLIHFSQSFALAQANADLDALAGVNAAAIAIDWRGRVAQISEIMPRRGAGKPHLGGCRQKIWRVFRGLAAHIRQGAKSMEPRSAP